MKCSDFNINQDQIFLFKFFNSNLCGFFSPALPLSLKTQGHPEDGRVAEGRCDAQGGAETAAACIAPGCSHPAGSKCPTAVQVSVPLGQLHPGKDSFGFHSAI